jgi:XRE family transcriptional regulator, stress-response regulator
MRLREAVGDALRRRRQAQGRTLREVAEAAGVSLTYLSEVERGRKEASSEVLEAVCAALHLGLAELFFEVAETLALAEAAIVGVTGGMRGAAPPAVVGFLPPRPRAAAVPVPDPAPMAPVLDLRAFAGRRTA